VSTGSTFMMLLRLGFSLAFVLGLIWCAAWVARRRNGQGIGSGPIKLGRRDVKAKSPGIEVLERKSVGRHGTVAVVRVGTRCLLVGITEQQVQLLSEIDSDTDADRGIGGLELHDSPDLRTRPTDVDLTDLTNAELPAETIQMAARRTGPLGTESRSPRMTLVDAMRELTVRRT
jgi:flagellar biosynthetic protein FliO